MDNFVVAASNLYAFRAVRVCIGRRDFMDAVILLYVMLLSIAFHVVETSTHGMTGIPALRKYERMTFECDRAVLAMAVFWFLSKYRLKIDSLIVSIGIASYGYSVISDCQHIVNMDLYQIKCSKSLYVIAHSLWHIGIFHVAYLLVRE